MMNVALLTHAALQPANVAALDEWWLATLLICLMPAALFLLWVIMAWCFLSDQPRSSFR